MSAYTSMTNQELLSRVLGNGEGLDNPLVAALATRLDMALKGEFADSSNKGAPLRYHVADAISGG